MDTKKLFTSLELPDPPEGFLQGVLQRIEKEELARLKRSIALFGICSFVCSIALIQSVSSTALQLAKSGFIIFTVSLFSDVDTLIAGGSSAVFALLESFPFLYAGVTLGIVFVLGIVLKVLWCDVRTMARFSHTTHI